MRHAGAAVRTSARAAKQDRNGDAGGPGEHPQQVGADSLAAEVEEAALGVDRRRSDPEVVEETPEGGEQGGGVGGAEARDVEEHEDGERHEERDRPDKRLEQAGDKPMANV